MGEVHASTRRAAPDKGRSGLSRARIHAVPEDAAAAPRRVGRASGEASTRSSLSPALPGAAAPPRRQDCPSREAGRRGSGPGPRDAAEGAGALRRRALEGAGAEKSSGAPPRKDQTRAAALPGGRGYSFVVVACSVPLPAGRDGDVSATTSPTAATTAPAANATLLVVAHVTPRCAASRPA